MPAYGYRLLALLVGGAVLAMAARAFIVDDSYYVYGNFRGASVPVLAAPQPAYRGSASCRECHTAVFERWHVGSHGAKVQCEVCHGPSREHAEKKDKLPIPEDRRAVCSQCHEKMPARPDAQPQVVISEHAGDQQCTVCHNQHSPKIGGAAAEAGVGATRTSRCAGCHGARGEGVGNFPPLAGKSVEYLTGQLVAYREGKLANPMMTTLAKGLDDEAIKELAEFYAGIGGEAGGMPPMAESCLSCHGEKGEGADGVPALAGVDAEVIARDLRDYKSGRRPDPVMRTIADPLGDEAIEALANYFAGLGRPGAAAEEPAPGGGAPADAESCSGCHGERGEGMGEDFPPLAGKDGAYLAEQLQAYRSGARPSDMMAGIAEELDDATIQTLAEYYAGLPGPAKP